MEDNPDLTREAAEDRIKQIDDDNNRFKVGGTDLSAGLFDE